MRLDYSTPYPSSRSPVMGRNVVATSQPLASMAAMEMFARGGNAVDAIVAAAMTLTVVEPTGCGIGSDGFAILWDGHELHALNSSGRSPAAWTPDRFAGRAAMPERGWESVTTPGAVAAWIELSSRFGKLDLKQIAAPAIRYARNGFMVSPIIAEQWRRGAALLSRQPGFELCFMPGGRAPRAGELFRSPAHAETLESIAQSSGRSFYVGDLADKIVADAKRNGSALSLDDLGNHRAEWVGTLSCPYADVVVHELPPNGQGIAALMGLGILVASGHSGRSVDDPEEVHLTIEATKLALADLYRYVGDVDAMPVSPAALLDPDYLALRAKLIDPRNAGDPGHGAPRSGGTVCLSAGDESGMMISFIQSNYMGFGSGVVVPGTGISLQNRGAGFSLAAGHPNRVGSSKRPFHTIIPGFGMAADGRPLMAFGLMGGPMQAQGHVQLINRIAKHGQNPQVAIDAPRWRILAGRKVAVEASMDKGLVAALVGKGHDVVIEQADDPFAFGGSQIVMRADHGGYIAGSDGRKDGMAIAL
jgi:gamma-glutamyltranspeptidase / glutathione hydrolase